MRRPNANCGNAVAEKIMKTHGVAPNDLHALSKSFAPELFQAHGNVHFKTDGFEKLAAQLAAKIVPELH